MPITPQDFVTKWKRVTAREKQTYQEHFLDLCHLVGHPTPNEYDPAGTRFAFEMGVAKTSGGQGWADVAKLGNFGWEYKGKDSDLEKAYNQLLRYRDSLHNPPLLIVSDINKIVIRTNYTNLPTRTITLTLDDLLKPDNLKILKTVFFTPEQLKPQITIEGVTREAASQFSRLADNLRRYGSDPQEIAHFLIRLLFCLFAEDIGLLPENLFPRLLEQTRRNSKDFSEVLRQLFRAMNTGGYFGSDKILHFNGGLFDNENVLPLDSADMGIIADIDALDWGAIEPSIIPDHKLHVIARNDDYFLGLLQSKIHEVWSLKMGSTLEDRPSYSSSRIFETFPFPWASSKEPKDDTRVQAISQAAKELVEQRDRWLNATPTAPLRRGTSPKSAGMKIAQQNENADLGQAGRGQSAPSRTYITLVLLGLILLIRDSMKPSFCRMAGNLI